MPKAAERTVSTQPSSQQVPTSGTSSGETSIFSGELQISCCFREERTCWAEKWVQYFVGCLRSLTYSLSTGLGWVTAAQPRRHKKHKQPAGASGFGLRGFESYHAWKETPTAGQCLGLPHTPAVQTQREGEYHRKRFLLEHSCFEWQNNKNNNSNSKNVQIREKKIPQKT